MLKNIICDIQGVLLVGGKINTTLIDFLLKNVERYEKLILYSNLNSKNENILKDLMPDLFENIDKVYYYDTVKYPKPDTRGFKEILDENKLKVKDVVFLDDTFENIQTAKELGLETIYYEGEESIKTLNSFLSH